MWTRATTSPSRQALQLLSNSLEYAMTQHLGDFVLSRQHTPMVERWAGKALTLCPPELLFLICISA